MIFENDYEPRCIVEALADDAETARLRRAHEPGQGNALDGDMTIEALPTCYRGTTFRSALEASWAATLDTLGITWQYEPEMINLPSGSRYLPDFHLPEIGTWIEVKGTGVPRIEKAIEFGRSLACDCPPHGCTCHWPGGELVIVGKPPKPLNPWADERYDHWPSRSRSRLARRHGGFLNWTSTRGRGSWITTCPGCRHVTWFDSPYCRACRRRLANAHGSQPGDEEFTFIRISGPAVGQAS